MPNESLSSNYDHVVANFVRFNSIESIYEIIGHKLTRFVHSVAELLPFNPLKAALRLSNPERQSKE